MHIAWKVLEELGQAPLRLKYYDNRCLVFTSLTRGYDRSVRI